jgi:hypothetical protein
MQELENRFVLDLGAPPWRRVLWDGLELLSMSIKIAAPNARWWVWGSFTTNRAAPLFGARESLDVALIVPADVIGRAEASLLWATRRSALEDHMVDVHELVFEFASDHPYRFVTDAALTKMRSRASRTIMDDGTWDQIDAGFVEVQP